MLSYQCFARVLAQIKDGSAASASYAIVSLRTRRSFAATCLFSSRRERAMAAAAGEWRGCAGHDGSGCAQAVLERDGGDTPAPQTLVRKSDCHRSQPHALGSSFSSEHQSSHTATAHVAHGLTPARTTHQGHIRLVSHMHFQTARLTDRRDGSKTTANESQHYGIEK